MLAQAFVPTLGGSAYRNRGVEPLLDAVVDFLPSPGDLAAPDSRPAADPHAPQAALAFKVVSDGHAGMVFVRVYRGRLRRGDTVLNAESGQVIPSGMGELQLEVAVERLRSRHGIEVAMGQPEVAYRETISRETEVHHVHKKQTGGPGQFAELWLRLAPLERRSGLQLEVMAAGCRVSR